MQKIERTRLLSIALLSVLSSMTCLQASPSEAMGRFPADDPIVVVQTKCPALKSYGQADTVKAGAELKGLMAKDPAAVTPQMIADYKLLRDMCRSYTAK